MNKFLARVFSLATIVCVAFGATACGMSDDPDDIKENLEDNGYKVVITEERSNFRTLLRGSWQSLFVWVDSTDIDSLLLGADGNKLIYVLFCGDENTAADIYALIDATFEKSLEEMNMDVNNYSLGIDSTVVYWGHNDAIEAAKD